MKDKSVRLPGIGLALSGGGFRAALFHLGSLWRLNELGIFPRLKEVTGVSGGSIVGAYLGLKWEDLEFDSQGVAQNFQELIFYPIRSFLSRTVDSWTVLPGVILPFVHPGDILSYFYRKHLFGQATLQDLPSRKGYPRFSICATSLQTGSSVRMSKAYLADHRVGYIRRPDIPLCRAVAASSAFPPYLSPLLIRTNPDRWRHWSKRESEYAEDSWGTIPEGKYLVDERYRRGLWLVDGGIYDNMGLERIWDRYETVLVSDAGAPFTFKPWPFKQNLSWYHRTRRANRITAEQARDLRRKRLFQYYITGQAGGAYWGIGKRIDKYHLVVHGCGEPMVGDNHVTRSLCMIKTRMKKLPEMQHAYLINWGYALTDAAMRRHMLPPTAGPGQWPFPEYALDDPSAQPVEVK